MEDLYVVPCLLNQLLHLYTDDHSLYQVQVQCSVYAALQCLCSRAADKMWSACVQTMDWC